jgi:hypothetical protein
MTMCSDSSVASPIGDAHHEFDFEHTTPGRSLSFSESEPDCCATAGSNASCDCGRDSDYLSASTAEPETPAYGVYVDNADTTPSTKSRKGEVTLPLHTTEVTDSETPTPKPEAHSASFFADTKPSPNHHRRHRSVSPSRPQPLSQRDLDEVLVAHRDPRNPQRSKLNRRERECSPVVQRRRRGSPAESGARIQKPLAETARSRPRGRKLAEGS